MPLLELSFLLLSIYWTAQVIKNVARTVAGIAAGWYFDTEEEDVPCGRASSALPRHLSGLSAWARSLLRSFGR